MVGHCGHRFCHGIHLRSNLKLTAENIRQLSVELLEHWVVVHHWHYWHHFGRESGHHFLGGASRLHDCSRSGRSAVVETDHFGVVKGVSGQVRCWTGYCGILRLLLLLLLLLLHLHLQVECGQLGILKGSC